MTNASNAGADTIPPGFPPTLSEAKRRHQLTKSRDPFLGILPALLNSADIFDYARETGLVFPFFEKHLKSASYSIRIGEQIVFWDEKGQQISKNLEFYEPFRLPKNSIVFIKTEEVFLLPDYMAMRFNLKIDKVHKGILLGTGPLVDPGFEGHLLIPLHNLTTNDYYFFRGQTFVWVEFTKTSENSRWNQVGGGPKPRTGRYREFPKRKKWTSPVEYLVDAHDGEIRSSVSSVLEDARQVANRARIISYATAISAGIALIALLSTAFVGGAQLLQDVNGRIDTLSSRLDDALTGISNEINQSEAIRRVDKRLDSHHREFISKNNNIDQRANKFQQAIGQLEAETRRLSQELERIKQEARPAHSDE